MLYPMKIMYLFTKCRMHLINVFLAPIHSIEQPRCSSLTCTTPYGEFKLITYKIISFDLKHLLYNVTHQVGSLPSSKYWHVLFHLWPSYKPNGYIKFMVFPWRGTHCIPWCHLGCLYFHCQKCWILCFMWTNTCPLIAIP